MNDNQNIIYPSTLDAITGNTKVGSIPIKKAEAYFIELPESLED